MVLFGEEGGGGYALCSICENALSGARRFLCLCRCFLCHT